MRMTVRKLANEANVNLAAAEAALSRCWEEDGVTPTGVTLYQLPQVDDLEFLLGSPYFYTKEEIDTLRRNAVYETNMARDDLEILLRGGSWY